MGAALLAGCGSPGWERREPFAIGLYAVPNTQDFGELRALGFNLVVSDASERYLDDAKAAGIHVLARPGTSADHRPFDRIRATEQVRRFDRHPALWGWYLSDEPDLHRIKPSAIRAARDCIRQAGGGKPTALVLFNGREADLYATSVDRLLLDRYPIPWLPLADYSKHLRLARHAAGPDRPLYAVIQAFDWSAFPELLPAKPPLRPPSAAEMRAMTYLALLEGVRGVLYYSFDEPRWRIREHPETWEGLKQIVSEIREMEPLFQGVLRWRDFDVRYADPQLTRNEALDPTIQAARIRVDRGSKETLPGDYLVAVNTMDRPVTWAFGWPHCPEIRVPVASEEYSISGESGWFTVLFEPYGVRILGPLPAGCHR